MAFMVQVWSDDSARARVPSGRNNLVLKWWLTPQTLNFANEQQPGRNACQITEQLQDISFYNVSAKCNVCWGLKYIKTPMQFCRNSSLWITMTLLVLFGSFSLSPSSLEFDMWFRVVQSRRENHSRPKKPKKQKQKQPLSLNLTVTKNLLVLEAQLFWTAYHVVFDNPLTSTAFWIFQQTNSFLFTDWVSKLNRERGGHVWDMGLQLAQTYF